MPTERLIDLFTHHLGQGQEDFEIESAYGKTWVVNNPGRAEQILRDDAWRRTPLLTMALGNGLLASDGELWARQRQGLAPHFGSQLLQEFGQQTLRLLRSRQAHWDHLASHRQIWDTADDLSQLTLEVAAAALFSLEGPELNDVSGAVSEIVTGLGKISATLFSSDLRLDPDYLQRLRCSIETLDQFSYQLIARRRQQPVAGYDLLTRLLEMRDAEGEPLPLPLLRDEIVTAIISGHETTSQAVCWALMLLCQHPHCYQFAQKEARAAVQGDLLKPGASLSFIQAVLQETLRLFPPVWYMGRRCQRTGSTVVVSPWLIHRHPEHWEHPLDFRPQRFLTSSPPPPQIYLPFGAGRHICLGRRQALLEGSLILATLLGRYQLRALNAPMPKGYLTLRHWPALQMQLEFSEVRV